MSQPSDITTKNQIKRAFLAISDIATGNPSFAPDKFDEFINNCGLINTLFTQLTPEGQKKYKEEFQNVLTTIKEAVDVSTKDNFKAAFGIINIDMLEPTLAAPAAPSTTTSSTTSASGSAPPIASGATTSATSSASVVAQPEVPQPTYDELVAIATQAEELANKLDKELDEKVKLGVDTKDAQAKSIDGWIKAKDALNKVRDKFRFAKNPENAQPEALDQDEYNKQKRKLDQKINSMIELIRLKRFKWQTDAESASPISVSAAAAAPSTTGSATNVVPTSPSAFPVSGAKIPHPPTSPRFPETTSISTASAPATPTTNASSVGTHAAPSLTGRKAGGTPYLTPSGDRKMAEGIRRSTSAGSAATLESAKENIERAIKSAGLNDKRYVDDTKMATEKKFDVKNERKQVVFTAQEVDEKVEINYSKGKGLELEDAKISLQALPKDQPVTIESRSMHDINMLALAVKDTRHTLYIEATTRKYITDHLSETSPELRKILESEQQPDPTRITGRRRP